MSQLKKYTNPLKLVSKPHSIASGVGAAAGIPFDGTGSEIKNSSSGTWLTEDDAGTIVNLLKDGLLIDGVDSAHSVSSSTSIDIRKFNFDVDNSATFTGFVCASKRKIIGTSDQAQIRLYHNGSAVTSTINIGTTSVSKIEILFKNSGLVTPTLTGAQIKDDTFQVLLTFLGGTHDEYWLKLYPIK